MKIIIDTEVTDNIGITVLEYLYLHALANGLPTELDFDSLMELGYMNQDFEITNDPL